MAHLRAHLRVCRPVVLGVGLFFSSWVAIMAIAIPTMARSIATTTPGAIAMITMRRVRIFHLKKHNVEIISVIRFVHWRANPFTQQCGIKFSLGSRASRFFPGIRNPYNSEKQKTRKQKFGNFSKRILVEIRYDKGRGDVKWMLNRCYLHQV